MVPLGDVTQTVSKEERSCACSFHLAEVVQIFLSSLFLSLARRNFFASLSWIFANFFVGCSRDKEKGGEEAEEAFMQIEKE